jgi:hypothetical protein
MNRLTGAQVAAPARRDHRSEGNIGNVRVTPAEVMNRRLENRPVSMPVSSESEA